jgi:uncharacterized protein (TIGR02722 family)
MKTLWIVGVAMAIPLISACSSFQGKYQDPETVEILDDRWNDSDSRFMAETMVESMLASEWMDEFKIKNKGERPVLLVSSVRNRTDEIIDVQYLTDEIRTELIQSGQVRFVTKGGRQEIAEEIAYQEGGAVDPAQAHHLGKQTGADFLLRGSVQSQVNARGSEKSVVYKTELQLVDLETAEIVWAENRKVKKRFHQSGAKF